VPTPSESRSGLDPKGFLKDFLRPWTSHISRHIGKTPSSLIDRICSEPGCKRASSFGPDIDVAQLVRRSIDANRDFIGSTFTTRGRDRLEYSMSEEGCGLSILWDGYGLAARMSDEFRVVLAKDPSMRYGFFVMTAYPTFSMKDHVAPVDLERALLRSASFRAPATDSAEALKKGAMRASAYLGEDIPVVNTRNTVQALLPVSGRGLPQVSVAARIDHGRLTATQFAAIRRASDGSTLVGGIPEGAVGMSASECLRRMLESNADLKARIHRASELVSFPKSPIEGIREPRGKRSLHRDRKTYRTPPPPKTPEIDRDDGLDL
jgi:hypothetical protein